LQKKKVAKPLASLADLAGTLEEVLSSQQQQQQGKRKQQSKFGQSVGTLKARTTIL
jgi:hypothetical protein